MDLAGLNGLVREIVLKAKSLKDKHTSEKNAQVNYACVFCPDREQYELLRKLARGLGNIVKETSTGPVFRITPLETAAGKLELLKIRKPDPTRPERGDADFTVGNYAAFKNEVVSKQGFSLIVRKESEMIELTDPKFNVRAYFSNPPLETLLTSARCPGNS